MDSKTSDEDLVKKIRGNIKRSLDHIAVWRTEAYECYDFFASKQWSTEDTAKLKEENRPVIVFNRTARTVNAVCGLELQNRQEVRFTPREKDDANGTETLSSAVKWARDNCDAEDEESESFQDALICGMGWTETVLDYEIDPDGSIIINREDPFMMGCDPDAKKKNLVDKRFVFKAKPVSKEEFKEFWGDVEPESDSLFPDIDMRDHDATDAYKYENDQADNLNRKKPIIVTQYQWWERETFYRAETETGKIIELDKAKFGKIKDYIKNSGLKYVKQTRRVYKQAFINGNNILEMGKLPCNAFSFNCITGLRDRNANTWFGIVSLMKDPQRWANKWLSQILHIINSNAKGGLMYETGAIKNPRSLANEWAKPNAMIELAPGALSGGKVQQRESPRTPDGLDRLLQLAMQNISDIPGVNLELMGVANRDQAGYLEEQRKEAGVTILAAFFDSMRRYRKEQGRLLANLVVDYISDGRLIRIVGNEGAQYVPLLKTQFDVKYDVVVDDAPTSPHMKEKVFRVVSTLLPTLMQAGIPIPPDILDYAPLPESLIQKWKELLNTNKQQDPIKEQLKQISLALAQLEVQGKVKALSETDSKTALNYAKAEQAHATGENEAQLAQDKMGLESQSQDHKNLQLMSESARKDVEMVLNQQRKDLEMKLQEKRNRDATAANSGSNQ